MAKVKEAITHPIETIKEVIRDERKVGDMEHREHEIADRPELLAADRFLRLRIVSANFIKEDDHQHAFAVVTVGRNVARTVPRPLVDPRHTGHLQNPDYVTKQKMGRSYDAYNQSLPINHTIDPATGQPIPQQETKSPIDVPQAGVGEKEVNWEEHFSIEYSKGAENEKIHIEVFAKSTLRQDQLLGRYETRIRDVSQPKRKADANQEATGHAGHSAVDADHTAKQTKNNTNWSMSDPQEFTLSDKDGNRVGTIWLLLRREKKLYGTMKVAVREAYLEETAHNVQHAKCIMKLVNETQETPIAPGNHTNGTTSFRWNEEVFKNFDINNRNHVFDIFLELWNADPKTSAVGVVAPTEGTVDEHGQQQEINRGDKKVVINPLLLGHARLTIFDSRYHNTSETLPVFTFDNKHVGYLVVNSHLEQDSTMKNQAKKAEKAAKKLLKHKDHNTEEHHTQHDDNHSRALAGGLPKPLPGAPAPGTDPHTGNLLPVGLEAAADAAAHHDKKSHAHVSAAGLLVDPLLNTHTASTSHSTSDHSSSSHSTTHPDSTTHTTTTH